MAKEQGKSLEAFEKDFFAYVRPTSLIKRFATTEEVASLVAYVASPLASATTGAALRVDGGVLFRRRSTTTRHSSVTWQDLLAALESS
jgi:NAD(P)-dependent dehydrogenase (short-subunit alcohol dehydrogenase family)